MFDDRNTGSEDAPDAIAALVDLLRPEADRLIGPRPLGHVYEQPRRVWERETLARHVWRTEWAVNDHVIVVHVTNLRHKLGQSGDGAGLVRTVRGVGYRFGAAVEQGPLRDGGESGGSVNGVVPRPR